LEERLKSSNGGVITRIIYWID